MAKKFTEEALKRMEEILIAEGLGAEFSDLCELAARDVAAHQCTLGERQTIRLIKDFLS